MTDRRKRGGQPGNLNALKHGFYSEQFKNVSAEDIELVISSGLEDEIALMRVLLRKYVDIANGLESLADAAKVLDLAGLTATRLAQLIKVQVMIGSQGDSTLQTINDVIEEVNREFGLAIGG